MSTSAVRQRLNAASISVQGPGRERYVSGAEDIAAAWRAILPDWQPGCLLPVSKDLVPSYGELAKHEAETWGTAWYAEYGARFKGIVVPGQDDA